MSSDRRPLGQTSWVRQLARVAFAVGCLGVAATVTLLAWPLAGGGVSGSPLAPHYRPYYVGIVSYQAIPAHSSRAFLRDHGVQLPQDQVHRRRVEAGGAFAIGVSAMLLGRRARRTNR